MIVPSEYEDIIKLLIVGDSQVGKTNFISQFIEGKFDYNYKPSEGFDNKTSLLKLKHDKKIKLQIWDSKGDEKDLSLNRSLFLKVQGIIVMYDITNQDSFDHVENWIKYIKNVNDNIPIILVANKCDSDERIVTEKEGNNLAIKYNFTFVEASGKNNINVKTTFVKISEEVIRRAEIRMNSMDSDLNFIEYDNKPSYLRELIPYKDNKKNKKCCCC